MLPLRAALDLIAAQVNAVLSQPEIAIAQDFRTAAGQGSTYTPPFGWREQMGYSCNLRNIVSTLRSHEFCYRRRVYAIRSVDS
jgi:hypothetical protein